MLSITALYEEYEEEGKWKKYAIPAALLGTAGLLYLASRQEPDYTYYDSRNSGSSQSSYDSFKRDMKKLYDRGMEKADKIRHSVVQAWDDSESDRKDIADSAARGAEKASTWGHATADAAAQKWHDTAPVRQGILDRIQNGWNAHVQPQIDRAFPPSR